MFLTAGFALACAGQAYAQDATAMGAQTVGMVTVVKAADKASERRFSPDYSHALTPAQMTAAWSAEAERFVPRIPSTP